MEPYRIPVDTNTIQKRVMLDIESAYYKSLQPFWRKKQMKTLNVTTGGKQDKISTTSGILITPA